METQINTKALARPLEIKPIEFDAAFEAAPLSKWQRFKGIETFRFRAPKDAMTAIFAKTSEGRCFRIMDRAGVPVPDVVARLQAVAA